MIVSTSLKATVNDISAAVLFSRELAVPFIERGRNSLQNLRQKYNATVIVIIERQVPVAYHVAERFFFHPGMSELRILNMLRGAKDSLIEAMALKPGMSVLDCTAGLAADALVSSHAVTNTGKVVGLEVSPLIASVTRWGLQSLSVEPKVKVPEIRQAARNIEIIPVDHREYLARLADNSYDVVYFDPMFRRPKFSSAGILPLRVFADDRPLTQVSLGQALRVARLRVVVKEASGSSEFNRLGIWRLAGGKYSSVQYGVLFKEDCY